MRHAPGYISLLDTLESVIASCISKDRRMALLMIDLSHIEILIPVLGYRKISQILDAVQTELLEIKKATDILSRVNEYCFSLIIPDLKFETMVELASIKIVENLNGLRYLTGMETNIQTRTGAALFPKHGHTAEQILLGADTAVQGLADSNTSIVTAGSADHERIQQCKMLEAELEPSFMQSRFEMFYQPKVDLVSRQLYGAEALIRWNHPKNGQVSPELLIPILERNQLLQEITLWILNTALHQSILMRKKSPDFRIAVNLSPSLLASPDLVDLVKRALRIWDTDPQLLILEVTETSMMVNHAIAHKNLQQLNELGVLLSIDDFGTGYSSYAYLQQLPVQELKIDRSFITDLLVNKKNECLVRSMIHLGRDLGINVLAEGIETAEVIEHLANIGCQYGQGFYIAKPMPVAKMLEWINSSGWKKLPE
jgi:EAL domain-containing protein (putative c-di-GMP-specific phosphodiesterase class I)/GGDEF domain-containing protein